MELTRKQEEGLRIAIDRYNHNEPYTVIAGYAGTGKSTLINFIIAALEVNPEDEVAYITFTGKASEVLREKGCPNAMTAHKLLYYSKQMPNGKFFYRSRPSLEKDYKVIVVDEVSMLPKDMWDLLLTHGIYVIACGDPFQIPPIDKNQDNGILNNPHIFLDEVMRQAKESDIICLSMDIREGKKINPFKGNDTQVFNKKDLCDGMYFWADQILVSTNKSRHDINSYIRDDLGRGFEPEINDKVICLRNCWDTLSEKQCDPLINGSIGTISAMHIESIDYIIMGQKITAPVLVTDLITSNDEYKNLHIDYTALTTGEKFFNPRQEYIIRKNKQNPELPIEFNFGYAITGHRAQGSQWNKVLVLEESFPFDRIEHARWLYTTVTRAAEKLTLILKN
jgi:exodeoxyribonuclease-5